MTLYRDMTNEELIETALNWRVKSGQETQKRIIYALAKRLEEVSKSGKVTCTPKRDIAAVATLEAKGYEWRGGEQWAPPLGKIPDHLKQEPGPRPPTERPDSLAALYQQRGLSREARQWLRAKRPETWGEVTFTTKRQALSGMQNQGMGWQAGCALGGPAGTNFLGQSALSGRY